MKFVIMAGGQGTKLWPVSTDAFPKQFCKIIGDKTLIQLNLESLLLKYKPEDIYISFRQQHLPFIKEQVPQIPEENYIIEPAVRRDSGPASCYAMLRVSMKYPDEVIMFYVQPVVIRTPPEKYIEMIDGIEKIVTKHKKLVTGGMYPLYPETGSDYIDLGSRVADTGNLEVYNSNSFVPRKSTVAEVQEMLATRKLVLHTNHYTWTPLEFFEAVKKYRSDWYAVITELKDALLSNASQDVLLGIYEKFVAGQAEVLTRPLYDESKVQVVILPFKWTHITTWDDVYEYFKSQDMLKSYTNSVVEIDGNNNLIINASSKKLIATVDLKETIVVQTDDALFVCPKGNSGRLKDVILKLEELGYKNFL